VAISLGYMVFFGSVVVLPLWLQTQMNYTPTWAGLATAPIGVIPFFLSFLIGRILGIVDLRILTSFGFLVFALCSYVISTFDTSITVENVAWIRFVQGLGVPFFFIPLTTMILSHIPNQALASASGLSNFTRILAGSLGTSISVALWNRREALHQSQLVENLPVFSENLNQTMTQLEAQGLSEPASYAAILKTVVNQAYMLATNDVFWLAGNIFLGLVVFVWLAKPPFMTGGSVRVVAE